MEPLHHVLQILQLLHVTRQTTGAFVELWERLQLDVRYRVKPACQILVCVVQQLHVMETLLQQLATRQTICVFVELWEQQPQGVRFRVKHVNQEHVCAEQRHLVVEVPPRHQLVTRQITYVNVVLQHLVQEVLQHLHAMYPTISVFVER